MTPSLLSDPENWPDLHGDYLYRYALLRTREPVAAEEVVQETFLAALQARSRFSGQSSARSWFVGIMKHKIADHYRKSAREMPSENLDGPLSGGEAEESFFEKEGHWRRDQDIPAAWPEDPDAAVEKQEFWDVLKRCLRELPQRTMQAFTLREVDEVSTDEICSTLKITPNNLWVLLHRSRKHLRHCLERNLYGKGKV